VEDYAKAVGFNALFLCTASHEVFYQKCGFEAIYDVKINENTDGVVMRKNISLRKCCSENNRG